MECIRAGLGLLELFTKKRNEGIAIQVRLK